MLIFDISEHWVLYYTDFRQTLGHPYQRCVNNNKGIRSLRWE